MKVAFLSRKNPFDKGSWSGAFYSMYQQLVEKHHVEWVKPGKRSLQEKLILKTLTMHAKFAKKRLTIINKYYAKSTKRSITKQLAGDYDVIYATACPELFAYANTDKPIIYFLDATFLQLTQGYPTYSSLAKWNYRHGLEVERRALAKATQIIVTSEWAKQSAVKDFNADPKKISVIPFGANLQKEVSDAQVERMIMKRTTNKQTIKLLFIGKNWIRKGGQFVLDAFKILNDKGIKTELTIVGTVPPEKPDAYPELLNVIPNLNKNLETDFQIFNSLLEESHAIILPTRADCTPIVFSEAAAYGLPIVTTNVGGVPSIVNHNENGIILDLNDDASAYAGAIEKIIADKTYVDYCINSRNLYNEKLNWKLWERNASAVFRKARQLDGQMI
jgi:glycosyltransferase involved in cell wall biosynthesis